MSSYGMEGVNEVSLSDAWATGSRSYTDKTCVVRLRCATRSASAPRRLEALNIPLVRAGGLSLYSRDFNRQGFYLNQYPFLGSRADEYND